MRSLRATSSHPSGVWRPVEQQRELVAAEARDGVGAAHAGAQALGRLHEHAVAGLVAEVVVDALEVVEVDEHHGAWLAVAARALGRGGRDLVEQPPVRQPVSASRVA